MAFSANQFPGKPLRPVKAEVLLVFVVGNDWAYKRLRGPFGPVSVKTIELLNAGWILLEKREEVKI